LNVSVSAVSPRPVNVAREYPDHPVVAVGAVIVRDGRALIVKRAHEPRRGEWSLPGGLL
jgi:8-oxo-dGTP diphosphatase